MAIIVQRGLHLGMTQALLDYLRVDTLPEHQSGMSVAGVAQPIVFQPCSTNNLREGTTECPGEYWGTITVAEHRGIPINYVTPHDSLTLSMFEIRKGDARGVIVVGGKGSPHHIPAHPGEGLQH